MKIKNIRTRTIDSTINDYDLCNPQVTFNRHHIRVYNAFKREFGTPSSVLHPCCFTDASPSKVFDNVTYVDEDGRAIAKMREFELKAFEKDIRYYQPSEEHDLIILVRPSNLVSNNPEWATQHLRNGGLVLTEKYCGESMRMYAQPKLHELYGGIYDGEPDIDLFPDADDFDSERKPAKAFRFNKDKFTDWSFRDVCDWLREDNRDINWLVFKIK
ncbi:MAG: hypothetical protein Q8N63_06950 [Nanoarchaeota archaeon]|nr:hypothetical protein [Nanoarchaeota archaeon]